MQDQQTEATSSVETTESVKPSGPTMPAAMTRSVAARAIAGALALVIVAPIALSSSDLVKWAQDPAGLDLGAGWAWLVFVALDCAAATCVGMVILSAMRGESGGAFHFLTWVFAGASALANYRHGRTTTAADDELFFPAMSVLGPLLLDVVLHRVRRWVKVDASEQLSARAKFGRRWLPGVAFAETLKAWAVSQREGISQPAVAIALVRERAALVELDPGERVAFAWDALGPDATEYEVRSWLLARGVQIDRAALAAGRPVRITATVAGLDASPADTTVAAVAGACCAATTADVIPSDVRDLMGVRIEQSLIRTALRERHPGWPAETIEATAAGMAAGEVLPTPAPRTVTASAASGRRKSATAPVPTAGRTSGTRVKVLDLRAQHPDWSAAKIAKQVGVTDRTARRYLNVQNTETIAATEAAVSAQDSAA